MNFIHTSRASEIHSIKYESVSAIMVKPKTPCQTQVPYSIVKQVREKKGKIQSQRKPESK
jgi:hypothetical protein